MSGEIINLNVGGSLFSTTRTTLCAFPDSMLGAMFGGNMPTAKDENGRYFIDRNGTLFSYILDFLRTSQLTLPEDFKHYEQLAVEADFYQIIGIVEAVDAKIKMNQEPQKCAYQQLLYILESLPIHIWDLSIVDLPGHTRITGPKAILDLLKSRYQPTDDQGTTRSEPNFASMADTVIRNNNECSFVPGYKVMALSLIDHGLGEYLLHNGWTLQQNTTCVNSDCNNGTTRNSHIIMSFIWAK